MSVDEVRELREQLSSLQDRYLELEERHAGCGKALTEGSASVVNVTGSIEALYRDQLNSLKKELKKKSRLAKEERILHEATLRRNQETTEEVRALGRRHAEEAEMLRERVCDLQQQVERLQKEPTRFDSFDGEGHFQNLYRETLAALQQEQQQRREAAVASRTELQNTRELVEDAREDSASLRAELDMMRLRLAELDRAYQNDLRIEKEKEAQLEHEVRKLRSESGHDDLVREVARLRAMGAAQLAEEERERLEAEKQLLMEKQICTMEEVHMLREKLTDYDEMRKELFFALVLGLKLTVAGRGEPCNVDASQLWEQGQEKPFTMWKAWLEDKIK